MAKRSSSLPLLLGGLFVLIAGGAAALFLMSEEPATDPAPPAIVRKAEPSSEPSEPEIDAFEGRDDEVVDRPEPKRRAMGVLIGQLLTPDRRPVPRGRIELLEGTPLALGGVGHLPRLGPRAVVDAAGRFRIEDVPVSDQVVVRAIGVDFETTDSGPHLVRPDLTCDVGVVIVHPGLTVFGVVTDERGRAVPGARVAFSRGEVLAIGRQGVDPERVVLSDELGNYVIAHATRGMFSLLVSADGFGNAARQQGVQLEQPRQIEMNVRLAQATQLDGDVLLPGGTQPAINVEVLAKGGELGKGDAVVRTDSKGHFRFTNLAVGRHVLHLDPEGYLPETLELLSSAFQDGVQIELRLASGIEGVVTDSSGKPLKAFDLQLRRSDKRGNIGATVGAALRVRDPAGHFEVGDLVPGWYMLEVWARGHAVTLSQPARVPKNGGVVGVAVSLQKSASLRGLVVDDLGQPIAGARVSLHTNNTPTFGFLRASASAGSWLTSTKTGGDGTFEFSEVTAKIYQLEVDHPAFPVSHQNDVAVRAGDAVELPTVVLDRAAVLKGVVLGATGQTLKGVTVTLGGGKNRATRQVVSDGEGRFRFERLAPGGYQVHAYALTAAPIDVLFSSIARLKRDADGKPVIPVDVELAAGEEREFSVTAQG
jgi:protocatechuate 3,4-dioxygenase beta subunit